MLLLKVIMFPFWVFVRSIPMFWDALVHVWRDIYPSKVDGGAEADEAKMKYRNEF